MKRVFLFYLAILAGSAISFLPSKNRRYGSRSGGLSGMVHVIIDKSDYELKLYDERGWYATFPVVFGNDSQADKKMEGDRLTPEGEFKILAKRPHEKWSRFLLLDYPNQQHKERFNQLKASGKVPANATIGGGIGIHGTWPREEYAVDRYLNWTNGCISLKRADVEELYTILPVGTAVKIQK